MPTQPAERIAADTSCYLIGIGGVGLSGLARLLHAKCARVRGTETTPSDVTRSLATLGIEIELGDPPTRLP
ncbi:MAG: Mur ligase domain-containing protein, partial [Planctomycetota bacterium]